MFPGMNQRKMAQAMKKMGIQQTEIEATEVIIKCQDKEIIIENPQVSKVNMMGQMTFQVVGNPVEKELNSKPEINDDDIKTVIDQAKCSEDEAKNALEESNGDIAEAILKLQKE
jgi:nascent polypeptide-associated complex subunit alpha